MATSLHESFHHFNHLFSVYDRKQEKGNNKYLVGTTEQIGHNDGQFSPVIQDMEHVSVVHCCINKQHQSELTEVINARQDGKKLTAM